MNCQLERKMRPQKNFLKMQGKKSTEGNFAS
jgi:hypothetical protein